MERIHTLTSARTHSKQPAHLVASEDEPRYMAAYTVPTVSFAGSCRLSGGRTLHSSILSANLSIGCGPVFSDVGASNLAVVVTYSAGSVAGLQQKAQAPSRSSALYALGAMLFDERAALGRTRAVLVGKGSHCASSSAVQTLGRWVSNGKAHCIEGPNVGARESHTIWAFCHDFYYHLPRAVLFVQDDPAVFAVRRDLATRSDVYAALEASYEQRRRQAAAAAAAAAAAVDVLAPATLPPSGKVHARQQHIHRASRHSATAVAASAASLPPWVPAPCACNHVREKFGAESYGGFRPMAWWLRSFIAEYANGSVPLPSSIVWPTQAQFVMPRVAIKGRSRAFYRWNARLTEPPAPLKRNVPPPKNCERGALCHTKASKWANFGPMVVDLGAAPPRGAGFADVRPGINGMDAAQLYERTWFQVFDPAFAEATPAHLECFDADAIRRTPMRCAGAACPYKPPSGAADAGGCSSVDSPYVKDRERRCLGPGCWVGAEEGSGAWDTFKLPNAARRRRRRRRA